MAKKIVEGSSMKSCRYCSVAMPSDARLCKECGSFQDAWRTELKYWSGVVGLVTLVVSGLAFSLEFGARLHERLFGKDLAVSDFKSSNLLRIWNTSSVDIWITGVRFDSTEPTYSMSESVNLIVKKSKVGELNLYKLFQKAFKGTLATQLQQAGDYATDLTTDEKEGLSQDIEVAKNNVAPDFIMRDGPEHKHLMELHGGGLFGYSCTFVLSYRRVDDSTDQFLDVPCFGTVRRVKQQ